MLGKAEPVLKGELSPTASWTAARLLLRRTLVSIFAIGFFMNLLILVSPIYMLQIYDRVLTTGHHETLFYLTLIAIAAIIVYGLLEAVRSRILSRLGFALEAMLRNNALASWIQTAPTAGLARNQPLGDLQAVRTFLQGPGPSAFCDAPWAPLFIAVLFLLHPWLGWLGVASTIILLGLAIMNEWVARNAIRRGQQLRALGSDIAQSTAANADTILAMGMFPAAARRLAATFNGAAMNEVSGLDRSSMIVGWTRAARIGAQVLVLGVGAWLVLAEQMTAGGMIAGSIILGRALAPAEQAIGSWRSFVPARESWERLKDRILKLPEAAPSISLPRPEGHLVVENIGFRPAKDRPPVLDSVRFELRPG